MIMLPTTTGWTASGPITDDISLHMKAGVEQDLNPTASLGTVAALIMTFTSGLAPAQQPSRRAPIHSALTKRPTDLTNQDWAPVKLAGPLEGIKIAA
jgi:hypothetical protein